MLSTLPLPHKPVYVHICFISCCLKLMKAVNVTMSLKLSLGAWW